MMAADKMSLTITNTSFEYNIALGGAVLHL